MRCFVIYKKEGLLQVRLLQVLRSTSVHYLVWHNTSYFFFLSVWHAFQVFKHLLLFFVLTFYFKEGNPQPASNTKYSRSTEPSHLLMNTFKLFNLDMEICFHIVLCCKTNGEGQMLIDHTPFHRLLSKTVLIFTVYIPSCHNIVNWAPHNRRVWLMTPNPLPWFSVSCWLQGMQAGLGWGHHWRQQMQYPSGGGRNAQVQRLRPVPRAQPLFQPHREPVAGTLSAVLQPTA